MVELCVVKFFPIATLKILNFSFELVFDICMKVKKLRKKHQICFVMDIPIQRENIYQEI